MSEPTADLTGQIIVITGASDGIGAIAAVALSKLGATVIPVGRNPEKTAKIAAAIGAEPLTADYADLDQVRQLAKDIQARAPHIDVLINNAGGMFQRGQITKDGHEPNFQINHLATFLLTNLLKPQLEAAKAPRVLVTSSKASGMGKVHIDDLDFKSHKTTDWRAYGTGKLENIIFARELARRWAPNNITATAFHPGVVATEFGRDSLFTKMLYKGPLKKLFLITPEKGAEPIVKLASEPDRESINTLFFDRHKPNGPAPEQANDPELAKKLWDLSAELTGISTGE